MKFSPPGQIESLWSDSGWKHLTGVWLESGDSSILVCHYLNPPMCENHFLATCNSYYCLLGLTRSTWPCGWGLGSGLAEFISNSQKFSHVLAGHFRKIDFRNYSSVPTSPVLIRPYMLVLGQKCPYFCDFGIFPIRILMFWLWWHPIWVVAQIQMQE